MLYYLKRGSWGYNKFLFFLKGYSFWTRLRTPALQHDCCLLKRSKPMLQARGKLYCVICFDRYRHLIQMLKIWFNPDFIYVWLMVVPQNLLWPCAHAYGLTQALWLCFMFNLHFMFGTSCFPLNCLYYTLTEQLLQND